MTLRTVLACLAGLFFSLPAMAEMRGHGGPVRAIAISPDGRTAVTGSFDTTVILWDLERDVATQVLRFHEAPVNQVRMLGQGFVTGSDDGRIAFWAPGRSEPIRIVGSRGDAAVIALEMGLSAHADRTIRREGQPTVSIAEGPVALVRVGEDTVVATADQKLLWLGSGRSVSLDANALSLLATPDGDILAGCADGAVRVIASDGRILRTLAIQERPITSLSLSSDGRLVAAAGLAGAVKVIERASGREVSTLVGPGLPVWSLAFHPDGRTLYTGGADRMVRKWDVTTGQPLAPANRPQPDFPPSMMNARGAQVFRACEACHTVTPEGGNRAGPTLHGVFGRRIGTARDYVYSEGFASHGLIWDRATIARLFREGPSVVTPGTKMPEQRVTDEEDLQALVEWLETVTR